MTRDPIPVRIARIIGIMLMIFPGLLILWLMYGAGALADRWCRRRS